jgi:hypothetical protein
LVNRDHIAARRDTFQAEVTFFVGSIIQSDAVVGSLRLQFNKGVSRGEAHDVASHLSGPDAAHRNVSLRFGSGFYPNRLGLTHLGYSGVIQRSELAAEKLLKLVAL